MNIEEFRMFCLQKPGVTESFPFDENTLVFKVMNKMFVLTGLNSLDFRINLKCDPEMAIELREAFDYVLPGWHMNKAQWNTVIGQLCTDQQIKEWTTNSYNLVVSKLTKKLKEELKAL